MQQKRKEKVIYDPQVSYGGMDRRLTQVCRWPDLLCWFHKQAQAPVLAANVQNLYWRVSAGLRPLDTPHQTPSEKYTRTHLFKPAHSPLSSFAHSISRQQCWARYFKKVISYSY